MSAESLISSITEQSKSNSNKAIDAAKTYADQAISSSFLAFGAFPDNKVDPKFLPLNLTAFDPDVDLRDSYLNRFDTLKGVLDSAIPGLLDSFVNKYFGDSECFNEVGEFLCDAIKNKGAFLEIGEEANMRAEIQDRAFDSVKSGISAAYRSAGAKGNYVLPDFIIGAEIELYNTAAKETGKGNRDLTIKLVQMRLDWLDKCINHVIDMRKTSIQMGLEYMDSVYKSAAAADRNAQGYVASYKNFYDSLNGYYNAIGNINELRYKVAAKNADLSQHATDTFVTATVGALKVRAETATALANSMGVLAGSISSGLNTLASATNNTNNTNNNN